MIDEQVTGTIMALIGVANDRGYFQVRDSCNAGINFKASLPEGVEIPAESRGLFDSDLLQAG